MQRTLDGLEETFWARHANPKSGWTRVPTGAVLVYAVYRRDWRLLLAGLAWAALNPLAFPPPDSEDAWMTRAVLAERWWVREEGNGTVGAAYPNVCNAASALAFLYAFVAAWRRRPARAGVATVLASGLKLWWVGVLVRRFDAHRAARTPGPDAGRATTCRRMREKGCT
ncbi:DUF6653 family protein [Halobacterium yunchengense]|uniref:DUF6653 family protein n=1 Tax=Halobacterium yunchengense TaxID=3108497 RepID=UPI0030089C1B